MTNIVISNDSGVFDENFIVYLIEYIKLNYNTFINRDKIKALDEYITNNINSRDGRLITSNAIIASGFNNLTYKSYRDKYIIEIDNTVKMPFMSGNTVSTLCALINYGNADINGYDIFTQYFNFITKNIHRIYQEYLTRSNHVNQTI